MGSTVLNRAGALVVGLAIASPAIATAMPAEEFEVLAARCAPTVHPQTLAAVVRHESRFNPLAIGVNGTPAVRVRAKTLDEAVASAQRLIAQGRSIDLGLGQINSNNLKWLGLSVREVFEPCRNLAAAGRVLTENYRRYRAEHPTEQGALDAALSAYNTGNRVGGLRNGYVSKVRAGAGLAPRATEVVAPRATATAGAAAASPEPAIPTAQPVRPAAWDAFARAAATRTHWDPFARTAVAVKENASAVAGWGSR